jgi:hypothetical protein
VFNFRQNKSPFAIALGDWFPLRTYFLTSKASPNDTVIIVIIIVSEAELVLHSDGIIAQRFHLERVDVKATDEQVDYDKAQESHAKSDGEAF